MFTIYECVCKKTGNVISYLIGGDGKYAWVYSNHTEPSWYAVGDVKTVMSVFPEEEYNIVGEVENEADIMPFIKMLKLIEV